MRLLSRLEYERSFGARWATYFVRIPNNLTESPHLAKMIEKMDQKDISTVGSLFPDRLLAV